MINKKGGFVANTLAIILTVFMVFPVYWMVISSFKPRADFFLPTPKFLPIPATLDNYSRVINDKDIINYAKNSLIVTVVVVILSILVAFLAATAVARFNFKGRKAYIVMLLAVQMVPFEALLISMFVLLNAAGLVNQLTGVMVAYLAFVLPFTIWTLRGFIANVPKDLEEAAMIDGCSQGQAFRKILFPLIAPGLVSTSVFAFVMAWNEFILANVILLDQKKQTLPVWLTSFQGGQKAIDWGGLMAGSVLFAMPVIIFFVIVQGRIQRGALEGGVKG
jgi:N,N'-diacetylchitobiose transport system permease protein